MRCGNISFTACIDAHVPSTSKHTYIHTQEHKRTAMHTYECIRSHSQYAYENESVSNILISHLRGPNKKA